MERTHERALERVAKGLAGVIVDDTAISEIDGQAGALRYRGYAIEELVLLPFESVALMLLNGALPDASERHRHRRSGAYGPRLESPTPRVHLVSASTSPPDDKVRAGPPNRDR